jgi:hypothetical protein
MKRFCCGLIGKIAILRYCDCALNFDPNRQSLWANYCLQTNLHRFNGFFIEVGQGCNRLTQLGFPTAPKLL